MWIAWSARLRKISGLALLCLVAYAPALKLPLMEDDYPNIAQALRFGSAAAPLSDPIFRPRATSYWAMQALHSLFGMAPAAYHAASLLLHIANSWLLYFVLTAWARTRAAALWAAGFFAVYEGHQEAVIWFSAINELLLFLFGFAALALLLRARRWLLPSLASFALALLSKETAVLFGALAAPAAVRARRWAAALPYLALTALAVASIAATRTYSFRFSDGSFSLRAPFWLTWPRGMFRLLWFWGWIAGAIVVLRARAASKPALAALAWMALALLPYSFLAYSTQIPSRQTYLASAGLWRRSAASRRPRSMCRAAARARPP